MICKRVNKPNATARNKTPGPDNLPTLRAIVSLHGHVIIVRPTSSSPVLILFIYLLLVLIYRPHVLTPRYGRQVGVSGTCDRLSVTSMLSCICLCVPCGRHPFVSPTPPTPSIYRAIRLSIQKFICLSFSRPHGRVTNSSSLTFDPSVVRPSVRAFVRPSFNPSFYSSLPLYVRTSINLIRVYRNIT